LDQKVEDLNNDYHLLLQNVEEQQNIFISLRRDSDKIKEELKSGIILQEELVKLKKEFDLLSEQIELKKSEMAKIEDEKNQVQLVESEEKSVNDLTQERNVKPKRCSAKTKNGRKCKRIALDNSNYCKQHSNSEKR
jgi:hypothetical protein